MYFVCGRSLDFVFVSSAVSSLIYDRLASNPILKARLTNYLIKRVIYVVLPGKNRDRLIRMPPRSFNP
jgi:hypothetical protein